MSSLFSSGYWSLFLIIAIGLTLGRVTIKGISLDVSAVLFVALVFGHYGASIPDELQKIGLLLFIFTIGIQAGPGFFEAFRKRGIQLIGLVCFLVVIGALTTAALAWLFDIDLKIAVGLFAGALTSTPGLAAAIESSQSPMASIGYGIAYPFGVIGVILFVRLLPRILKLDIHELEKQVEQESRQDYPEVINRNFLVENKNVDGKPLGSLNIRSMTGATVSRVMHNDHAITPTVHTPLHLGDLVKAVGTPDALACVQVLIGSETKREIPLARGYEVQWVLVTNKEVVNKSLAQLNLLGNYNANVTRIARSGIHISPSPASQIRFGDKLMIACDKENMKQVLRLLGNDERRLSETDFLPIAAGIVLGIFIGMLEIPLFAWITFKPGLTGGVLAAALVLSRIGKTGPVLWTLSWSGNQLLRQLGLLLFLAAVGTKAGAHLVETISMYGLQLFVIGAVITIIPMVLTAALGLWLFRFNLLVLLGALTGGMTSTPGLAAVTPMTDSDAPSVAYAAVYPIALVVLIICAQILGRL